MIKCTIWTLFDFVVDTFTLKSDSMGGENGKLYVLVLWNNWNYKTHAFNEVISTVCEVTGVSESVGKRVAERVDTYVILYIVNVILGTGSY